MEHREAIQAQEADEAEEVEAGEPVEVEVPAEAVGVAVLEEEAVRLSKRDG